MSILFQRNYLKLQHSKMAVSQHTPKRGVHGVLDKMLQGVEADRCEYRNSARSEKRDKLRWRQTELERKATMTDAKLVNI